MSPVESITTPSGWRRTGVPPGLGPPAGEEHRLPVHEPVERAQTSLAIVRGDPHGAAGRHGADLRVRERRSVEVAGLAVGREPRPAHGDPVDGREVLDVPHAEPGPRPRHVESARGVDAQRSHRRDPADSALAGRVEALARDVHLGREPGGQGDLGVHGSGDEEERQEGEPRSHPDPSWGAARRGASVGSTKLRPCPSIRRPPMTRAVGWSDARTGSASRSQGGHA